MADGKAHWPGLPHSSLILLTRLKLRAAVRRQVRRMRTPAGALFALLGVVLIAAWAGLLFFARTLGADRGLSSGGVLRLELVQVGCLVLTTLTVFGALHHRGLYLPAEEIGRLFSGPFRRADLIRYRLINHVGRSLYAGVIFGLLSLGRFPNALFGFFGVVATLGTLPILGQALSILLGGAEGRLRHVLDSPRMRLFTRLAIGAALFTLIAFVLSVGTGRLGGERDAFELEAWLEHPAARVALAPFTPWARLITAVEPGTFGLWLLVCGAIWVAAFELTARVPVDYRELSLDTSADVARRLRRSAQRGIGASSIGTSDRARLRSVPWLFGRGPFGAVAWLKTASIVRKARGTLLISMVIVGLLTLLTTGYVPASGDPNAELIIAGSFGLLGSVYLCGALRFDFRMDLDRLSAIKAWPLAPWRVFLANLLPEIVVIGLLSSVPIVSRAILGGHFDARTLLIFFALPLISGVWVATDNAVFLFAPVRSTPGQDGALHHTGRSLLLLMLRFFLLVLQAGLAAGMGGLVWWSSRALLGLGPAAARTLTFGAVWLSLALVFFTALQVGGRVLERFDVARDRA